MNVALKNYLLVSAAVLGASAARAQLLSDNFSYADGPLVGATGSPWISYSGTGTGAGNTLNVVGGSAIINQADTVATRQTVSAPLNGSFSLAGNTTAFVSFDATWTSLPSNTNGSYFAAFSQSTSSGGGNLLFGRIGADTSGAAAGDFRLAVANANWNTGNSAEFPLDLSLNTTYHVVVEYNLVSQQTTLWVNPTSSASTSVTATDAAVPGNTPQLNIGAFNLRQGVSTTTGAPGVIALDNLSITTAFSAVPEPGEYAALFGGGLVAFALLRRRLH